MVSKKATNILLILSAVIFLFGSGYKLGEYRAFTQKVEMPSYNVVNTKEKGNAKNIDFSLFWDTWTKLEEKYVDKKKIDSKKMFYGAIKGMVASVEDPYTFFMTPDENKQSKADLDGKFEGIGAQLGLKDNRITIIAPLKDSPAERAGMMAGDMVVKVDDNPVKGWSLTQAVAKIRGVKGTKVKILIEREGEEREFEITRDIINVSSVELSFNPGYAYLKLNQFGSNTNDEWDAAVSEVVARWQKKEIKGMILDLRDNPGGFLESSVYLASEFLQKNSLVVKQESASSSVETREYRVVRTGRLLDIPLAILVNKGSASASEILSGALRDHRRAKLIGEKTFGKGSVQEALDLKDNAGLHVTVAKWILPNGDWINGKGITPETVIENKITAGNTLTKETDAQLQKAIKEIIK